MPDLSLEVDDHLDDVPTFWGGLEGDLVHQALDEEDPPATRVGLPLDLTVDVGRGDLADAPTFVLHGDLEAAPIDRETDADLHAGVQLVPVLDGVQAGHGDGGLQVLDTVGREVHGLGNGGGEIHRDLFVAESTRDMELEFLFRRHGLSTLATIMVVSSCCSVPPTNRATSSKSLSRSAGASRTWPSLTELRNRSKP